MGLILFISMVFCAWGGRGDSFIVGIVGSWFMGRACDLWWIIEVGNRSPVYVAPTLTLNKM